jgi:hypothetical protein
MRRYARRRARRLRGTIAVDSGRSVRPSQRRIDTRWGSMRSQPVMLSAPTARTSAKTAPVATLTKKTVDRNPASIAGRWIMAGPVPSSMNSVATPKNASAISSSPRSSGVSRWARIAGIATRSAAVATFCSVSQKTEARLRAFSVRVISGWSDSSGDTGTASGFESIGERTSQ